jgi:AraC family transcriptional regulator
MKESVSLVRTQTADAHRRAVARVVHALRRNPAADFSLEDMARMALISRFHFNRIFRRLTGIPPVLFHSALRLQEAKRLMLTTDLSVTDVCFAVGYQSPGTFVRRFTERVGLSPWQVRVLGRSARPVAERLPEASAPPECGLSGLVTAPHGFEGTIFAGLFPRSILEGRPAVWALMRGPGRLRLPPVPDGDYHLCAATLPPAGDPAVQILDLDEGLRAGPRRIRVRSGATADSTDLHLRPPEPLDPPILLASPLLLA